jgi:nucleotide-binding universal stress UspA family protein
VVDDPDVAGALIRTAEEGLPATAEVKARNACDVITIATHGRSGPERWVMGSIAERILDGTRLPLFVVHPS